jgi:hypothetical protein
VIRYSYLWQAEHVRGREEGVKNRPCAIILISADGAGERVVTVLPISHASPADPRLAVEIPAVTKRRLGLDEARSWVVLRARGATDRRRHRGARRDRRECGRSNS